MIWKSVQNTLATPSVNIIWTLVYPTSMCSCGVPFQFESKEGDLTVYDNIHSCLFMLLLFK